MRKWNKIFEEIMVKTFSNLMKTINPPIQEVQQIPCKSEGLGKKKDTWVLGSHSSKTSGDDKISRCGVRAFPSHEVGQNSCIFQSSDCLLHPKVQGKGASPFFHQSNHRYSLGSPQAGAGQGILQPAMIH